MKSTLPLSGFPPVELLSYKVLSEAVFSTSLPILHVKKPLL